MASSTPTHPTIDSTKKCHPCRAKGMKRIEVYVSPERKDQLSRYCDSQEMTMAALVKQALKQTLDRDQLVNQLTIVESQLNELGIIMRVFMSREWHSANQQVYSAGVWGVLADKDIITTTLKNNHFTVVAMSYQAVSAMGSHFTITFRQR